MEFPLLFFILIIPNVLGQCTVEKALPIFRRSVYNFNADLTNRIADYSENHFVTSSVSIWTLLSAISEGADGKTLEELQYMLKHSAYRCFTLKYYEIIKGITARSRDTTLERSGVIVIDNSMGVLDGYRRSIEQIGIGDVLPISFNYFDLAANSVNEYVEKATHGAITDVVNAEDFATKYLFLIDAIYFKGKWRNSFNVADTETTTFYNEKGEPIGDVNMMFQIGTFRFIHVPIIKSRILELPYGDDDRFSMLIILPLPDESINAVIDNLKFVSLKSIFFLLAEVLPEKVLLNLPRFKITSELDLKDLLMDMGLTRMFDEVEASFPHISKYSLYVSDLIQKANFEVTEEGTTAAAASEAGLSDRSMPEVIDVNKPFFFLIVDKRNEIVLFSGAYSKPSLY